MFVSLLSFLGVLTSVLTKKLMLATAMLKVQVLLIKYIPDCIVTRY